jgi:ABC-type amino acid transport substrate-binding protein
VRSLVCLLLLAVTAAAQDRPLQVGTKEAPPFAMRRGDGTWSGLGVGLWKHVAQDLGLKYEWRELPLPELLAGVADGSLDAAVAAPSVSAEREESMDFSHPYHVSGLGIAVSTQTGGSFTRFLHGLFSAQLIRILGIMLLLLLVSGLIVWVLERRRNPEQFGGRGIRGLGGGLWWSVVTMTTVGYGDKAPLTTAGRLVALIWMFASIVLLASFTASMASSLTVSHFESLVEGPQDLPGVRVGVVTDSTGAAHLDGTGVRYTGYDDAASALEALARGEQDAVVHDAPLLRYLANRELKGRVTVLPREFARQDYAIALPSGSPQREAINKAILRETSTEEWSELLERYLGR